MSPDLVLGPRSRGNKPGDSIFGFLNQENPPEGSRQVEGEIGDTQLDLEFDSFSDLPEELRDRIAPHHNLNEETSGELSIDTDRVWYDLIIRPTTESGGTSSPDDNDDDGHGVKVKSADSPQEVGFVRRLLELLPAETILFWGAVTGSVQGQSLSVQPYRAAFVIAILLTIALTFGTIPKNRLITPEDNAWGIVQSLNAGIAFVIWATYLGSVLGAPQLWWQLETSTAFLAIVAYTLIIPAVPPAADLLVAIGMVLKTGITAAKSRVTGR